MNCLLINEQDTKTGPITPRDEEEWGFPMNTVYYFCNIILILEGRQVCNFVVNAKASNSNWIHRLTAIFGSKVSQEYSRRILQIKRKRTVWNKICNTCVNRTFFLLSAIGHFYICNLHLDLGSLKSREKCCRTYTHKNDVIIWPGNL